ncbi:enoyl-CoA hydratase-related protein [Actibacterium sp.]|uniref:enoyl-CoA hydratase-related protein n=1 Tax=Actibacterium sp. TaxID=1872125 RepID=UPI00356728F5
MTNDSPLLYSRVDGIAHITLNRPERLNALTRDLLLAFAEAAQDAASRSDVRVISITGAGRAFCAGQDLADRDPRKLTAPLDLEKLQIELFHPVVTALIDAPQPVVACVNGVAAGAGSSLALAADMVIAGESAKFVQSFSNVGLSVDAGGGRALVRALGPARARAILMLGDFLTAEEAAESGLIWKAVPDDMLAAEHAALLKRLVAKPAMAMSGIKTALRAAQDMPDLQSYLAEEARLQGIAGRHPDYAEGVLAFLERRPPEFGKD